MLAPAQLPEKFSRWNKRHAAPFGRSLPFEIKGSVGLWCGDRRRLLGFPEFDLDFVREHRKQFISDVSGNALAQCLTARRA